MSLLKTLPKSINSIEVFVADCNVGLLTHGTRHHFQPIQTAQNVSLTMTQQGLDGFYSGSLHPIFTQNLPEGFNRHYIAEKLARYAKVNDMYLLALQANHGIGMLTYQSKLNLPEPEAVSLSDILNYSGSDALFPQLLEKYYLRNALAGIQPKVSIPTQLKTERTLEQKNLIVKSYNEEFPLLTVNEFVCMEAARFCGLEPPKTYLSDNQENFVIERFDINADGTKLGYEDFTTLLKKPNEPDAKYSGSYETLLKATQIYTNSQEEVEKVYSLIVFNCLIGNGDAHLKNFALQYSPDMSTVFSSPPFDITHTLIYDTIDNQMALKMANSKSFPDKNILLKLAESRGYKIRNAKLIIERLAQGILDYLAQSNEVLLFEGLRDSIESSISRVMAVNPINKKYRHSSRRKYD